MTTRVTYRTGNCRFRYQDSLHAALVAGLVASGATSESVIGDHASAWTFGFGGHALHGGTKIADTVTVSTSDASLGKLMATMDPASIKVRSASGDTIDLVGASRSVSTSPLMEGQTEVGVMCVSPVLIPYRICDRPNGKKYAESLAGVDLSAAISHGLSRRCGRDVRIEATVDRLTARTQGSKPVLVKVRKTNPTRDLIVAGLSFPMTLSGNTQDLNEALMGGIGAKTRYGFGCLEALD